MCSFSTSEFNTKHIMMNIYAHKAADTKVNVKFFLDDKSKKKKLI